MQERLIIVDPGHFHASLLQKEMYPSLARRVAVYAPLGPELIDYLIRISLFNSRRDNPTSWELDIHTSSDPMGDMLGHHPGNIVVFTGRNRGKIDRILQAITAGFHVFADKPWIISSADMPKLEQALHLAARKNVVAYDIMTERFEATSELQRVFVSDPEVFGKPVKVEARSIHHVMKVVAGVPLRRPAWFFDIAEYGEGLADVGTHVVDLVQWTVFADQAIDYHKDIHVLAGKRWPLTLTREQFQQVTGEPDFTKPLAPYVNNGRFDYFCNNSVEYTIKGVPVKLDILWNWEAPAGSGDVYEALFEGTKSKVEIRPGSELFIVPASSDVMSGVQKRMTALQHGWPGLSLEETKDGARIVIPEKYRVTHEAHFGQVATKLFEYLKNPHTMPAWETPNMLAKYLVSTQGVERASSQQPGL